MSKRRGSLLTLGGVLAAVAAVLLWTCVFARGIKSLSIGLALLAVVLLVMGIRRLAAQDDAATPEEDYRHAYRLFGTIFVVVLAASMVREVLVPATFGQYGAYRGDAVAEARKRAPRHLGKEACRDCHDKQVKLHDKDAHARVECEDCHGPGHEHARVLRQLLADQKAPAHAAQTELDVPVSARMRKPKGRKPCLTCHRRLEARPGSFAQVAWDKHYAFVGVADKTIACTECHDPHEPLFMDRDLRRARLHPVVHRCRDCHIGPARKRSTDRPDAHPAFFECKYCHSRTVADFADRAHEDVRCTSCHLFFRESAFAGRIIRDADPRFCLLCHEQAKFRSDEAPPGISWPAHLDEVAKGPEDARKRCVDCHRDAIHLVFEGDQ